MNILFFPVKPVLGKLMLILRFRRSVEMAGRNYHTFRLTDYALRAGWVAPAGPWSAAQMRDAIERVCDQSDISPVSAAFRQVLSKRSGPLKDTAKLFWKSLRLVAAAATRSKSSKTVGGVMAPLRTALEAIPPEHFTELEGSLEAELAREGVLAAGR